MKPMHSVGVFSLLSPTVKPALQRQAVHSLTARRNHPLRLAERRISSRYTHPPIPLRASTLRTTAMTSRWHIARL